MEPASGGLMMPGSVARVLDNPISTLAWGGAMSRWFTLLHRDISYYITSRTFSWKYTFQNTRKLGSTILLIATSRCTRGNKNCLAAHIARSLALIGLMATHNDVQRAYQFMCRLICKYLSYKMKIKRWLLILALRLTMWVLSTTPRWGPSPPSREATGIIEVRNAVTSRNSYPNHTNWESRSILIWCIFLHTRLPFNSCKQMMNWMLYPNPDQAKPPSPTAIVRKTTQPITDVAYAASTMNTVC